MTDSQQQTAGLTQTCYSLAQQFGNDLTASRSYGHAWLTMRPIGHLDRAMHKLKAMQTGRLRTNPLKSAVLLLEAAEYCGFGLARLRFDALPPAEPNERLDIAILLQNSKQVAADLILERAKLYGDATWAQMEPESAVDICLTKAERGKWAWRHEAEDMAETLADSLTDIRNYCLLWAGLLCQEQSLTSEQIIEQSKK